MCIIAMTELTKTKKLDICISKPSLLQKIIFSNAKEKEKFEKYLDLKGIAYHVMIINYIGLNKNGKVQCKKISDLYRYDKKLRNILYEYLSAFEENIRAYIANGFLNKDMKLKLDKKITKRIKSEGSNIATELENLQFNELLKFSLKLQKTELNKLYPETKNLKENLDAIRELRNTVSHHRILTIYDEFKECYVEEKKGKDLLINIKNLIQLIHPYYQQFMIYSKKI